MNTILMAYINTEIFTSSKTIRSMGLEIDLYINIILICKLLIMMYIIFIISKIIRQTNTSKPTQLTALISNISTLSDCKCHILPVAKTSTNLPSVKGIKTKTNISQCSFLLFSFFFCFVNKSRRTLSYQDIANLRGLTFSRSVADKPLLYQIRLVTS